MKGRWEDYEKGLMRMQALFSVFSRPQALLRRRAQSEYSGGTLQPARPLQVTMEGGDRHAGHGERQGEDVEHAPPYVRQQKAEPEYRNCRHREGALVEAKRTRLELHA